MQKPIENIEALIWKYLQGDANEQESKAVEAWRSKSENHREWDQYVSVFGKFIEAESKHQPANVDADRAWSKVQNAIAQNEGKVVHINRNFSSVWLKYAAVIVISVGLGWWFANSNFYGSSQEPMMVSYAPVDSIREITLPDGSMVSMKAGASLTYNSENQNVRKVYFEGDGYFEIHRDTNKPFVIEVGDAFVQVLGTSFYIHSVSTQEVEVSVNSGKVKLSHKQPQKLSDYVLLEKGEKGKVKDRKKPIKETLETLNFLSWRNHKFRFKNTRLMHVFEDLEEYYKVSFVVENESLLECRLSGKFYKQTLDELLDMLGMTFELQINREEDKITVQGEGCQ